MRRQTEKQTNQKQAGKQKNNKQTNKQTRNTKNLQTYKKHTKSDYWTVMQNFCLLAFYGPASVERKTYCFWPGGRVA